MGSTRQALAKLGVEPSYVVMGNTPMVLRESLLPEVMSLGERTIESSQKLFAPGLTGPFCLEMICTPELDFIVFEISARIVAGTNLFPLGSPYSCYLWGEGMSTGRRIAWEIKEAQRKKRLGEIIS
jgi:5-formaminoimidazole-4-carboxamide-1-(beta)-D-ribofuranosyl 5'-monophosphate synthetase